MQRVPSRSELLDLIPEGGVVAEVGVLVGAFSREILERCRPSRLYLIDLWAPGSELTLNMRRETPDGEVWEPKTFRGEDNYREVLEELGMDPRVVILRGLSEHVLSTIAPRSLDTVYIDADHTYKGCRADLLASFPAIKPGGWIMGHDYCTCFPGVVRAVEEFCKAFSMRIDFLTDEPGLPIVGQVPGRPEMTHDSFNSYAIRIQD